MVTARGEVKLFDFGIVKALGRVAKSEEGVVKGNIAFMSPEQARSEPVDARSDLFSLGLVIYYGVTNERLYRDDDGSFEQLRRAGVGPTPAQLAKLDDLPVAGPFCGGRSPSIRPCATRARSSSPRPWPRTRRAPRPRPPRSCSSCLATSCARRASFSRAPGSKARRRRRRRGSEGRRQRRGLRLSSPRKIGARFRRAAWPDERLATPGATGSR